MKEKAIVLLGLILFLLFVIAWRTHPEGKALDEMDGRDWFRWTENEQTVFVEGFILGSFTLGISLQKEELLRGGWGHLQIWNTDRSVVRAVTDWYLRKEKYETPIFFVIYLIRSNLDEYETYEEDNESENDGRSGGRSQSPFPGSEV
jgi:hypothetical protein